MFWDNYEQNPIQKLLDSGNFSLEDILSQREFPDECRAGNKKLLDYVMRPETLSSMIDIIVQSMDDTEDHARMSVTAANAIAAEQTISKGVFENGALVQKLLACFSEPSLPALRARNITKTVLVFIFTTHSEISKLQDFQFVEGVVNLIGNDFVGEMLGKLWDDDCIYEHESLMEYLASADFVYKMAHRLATSTVEKEHFNVVHVFRTMIEAREIPNVDKLVQTLHSQRISELIFQAAVSQVPSQRREALTLCLDIANCPATTNEFFTYAATQIKTLSGLLTEPCGVIGTVVDTPVGPTETVSISRFRIAQLLHVIVKPQNPQVSQQLASSGVLQILASLLFQNRLSSLFHIATCELFRAVLRGLAGAESKTILLSAQVQLLDNIARIVTEGIVPGKFHDNRVGCFVELSVVIQNLASEEDAVVTAAIAASSAWGSYCSEAFAKCLELHNAVIAEKPQRTVVERPEHRPSDAFVREQISNANRDASKSNQNPASRAKSFEDLDKPEPAVAPADANANWAAFDTTTPSQKEDEDRVNMDNDFFNPRASKPENPAPPAASNPPSNAIFNPAASSAPDNNEFFADFSDASFFQNQPPQNFGDDNDDEGLHQRQPRAQPLPQQQQQQQQQLPSADQWTAQFD